MYLYGYGYEGNTMLLAALQGNMRTDAGTTYYMCDFLLKNGVSVNVANTQKVYPLHLGSEEREKEREREREKEREREREREKEREREGEGERGREREGPEES